MVSCNHAAAWQNHANQLFKELTVAGVLLIALLSTLTGSEHSDDGREVPRSPTVTSTAAGNSHVDRGSTSSDSAAVTNTDHIANSQHSTDDLSSKCILSSSDRNMFVC